MREILREILILSLLLLCLSLLGCTWYVPPAYVCACNVTCRELATGSMYQPIVATLGNNTKEELIKSCENYAATQCLPTAYEIVNIECNPMKWDEWMKMKEAERAKGRGK